MDYLIDVAPEPKAKPPKKTWWKVENCMAVVREVTDANKRYYDRWNFMGSQFFETKEEAVAVKQSQLEAAITRAKDDLRKAEIRLRNFKKKFL